MLEKKVTMTENNSVNNNMVINIPVNEQQIDIGELQNFDLSLYNLLSEWKLECLYLTLRENDINYDNLQYLSKEDINDAVKSIGLRAHFREKLFGWKKEKFGIDENLSVDSKVLSWIKSLSSAVSTNQSQGSPSHSVASLSTTWILRNKANYKENMEQSEEKETGIKENCFLNDLPSYHVTENFCFDIMHDIFEGVCEYDVCNILLSLIEDKIVTLNVINSRKSLFQYGESEVGNLSPNIDMQRLKNSNLKMTAREIWTFVHFIPLMIGDLIPLNYRPWKLLCILIEIIDIILQTSFNPKILDKLQKLIEQHHSLYVQLYGPNYY